MILTGSFTGFWITALIMTLPGASMGARTKKYSINEPSVPFPPALPSSENLHNICHSGNARRRYPNSFFPRSGASHFRRRGKAINRLESWFTYCCGGEVTEGDAQILCCAQQAWKQALSHFCMEEYATMTLAYPCCAESDDSRWLCFNSGLSDTAQKYSPIPGYSAPALPCEPGFTFDASSCQV